MRRKALEKLLEWKQSNRRKPLIIKGARQVGKSWFMEEERAKRLMEEYPIAIERIKFIMSKKCPYET